MPGWRTPCLAALVVAMGVAGPTTAPAQSAPAQAAPLRGAAKRLADRNASRYDEIFRRYTKRYFGPGFDWRLFKAQGMAESGLDPDATSYVGARGIMQLMPATYQGITSRRPEFGAINDPEWNIAAGIMHDRYLWKLWSESISERERPAFMFGSYNAGEGTIRRARRSALDRVGAAEEWAHIEEVAPTVPRWRYRETLDYVRKIDRYYGDIRRPR
ncbi:MAG: transglycosylase SLT domain-containing protein [Gemmatimonadetes bacterium]|nr:transglycosylase SLT domain-containing protein [Gemmatimonadota bacterium]